MTRLPFSSLLLVTFYSCLLIGCSCKKKLFWDETPKETNFSAFTAIKVNCGIGLVITQGKDYKVSIIAPQKALKDVRIKQCNETLYITMPKKLSKERHLLGLAPKDITVQIMMPYITQIDLAETSEATFIGNFEAAQFSAVLSEASKIDDLSISANKILIKSSGSSAFSGVIRAKHGAINMVGASKLDLIADQIGILTMRLSGSSKANILGSASSLTAKLFGVSQLNGEQLAIPNLDIALMGTAKAAVFNSESLCYRLNGASQLIIHGSPKILEAKKYGSSKVEILDK